MQIFNKDTQITQTGHAVRLNAVACQAISQIFSSIIGPDGSSKLLITPGNVLALTKSGFDLSKEVQFSNPTSKLITQGALNISTVSGDLCSTFITLVSEMFVFGFKHIIDGVSITSLKFGLKKGLEDVLLWINANQIQVTDMEEAINSLAYSQLITKFEKRLAAEAAHALRISYFKLVEFAKQQPKTAQKLTNSFIINETGIDPNMVEIIPIPYGEDLSVTAIDGIVLDHGPRHPKMPESVDNACILITQINFEYEDTEIKAEFVYRSAAQRNEMIMNENLHSFNAASKVVSFAKTVKETSGRNLIVVTEKGIDKISLQVFADAGILAVRRAKRRNMERLVNMFGGSIVTDAEKLDTSCLGHADQVRVENHEDEKFTFITGGTKLGSSCILIRGEDSTSLETCLRNALKGINALFRDKVYLEGGLALYTNLCKHMESKFLEISTNDILGYKIIHDGILEMAKILLRNKGAKVEEELHKIRKNGIEAECIDGFEAIARLFEGSVFLTMNLLMIDDIIMAGKQMKQEREDDKLNIK